MPMTPTEDDANLWRQIAWNIEIVQATGLKSQ
jgi:hypothetical protein